MPCSEYYHGNEAVHGAAPGPGNRRSVGLTLAKAVTEAGPYNIRTLSSVFTKEVKDTARLEPMALDEDRRLSEVARRERSRLLTFIRRRGPDPRDAEDILQDVFYELVEANRRLMPIDHLTGWLFRVARNRIIDLFRKKTADRFSDAAVAGDAEERLQLEDLLPSPDAGPDAVYARTVLLEALEMAVDELPAEQREVFVRHELEGHSFKEMSAQTGVSVNTLLSRKRYAVRHLRARLQRIYDERSNP